MQRILINMNIFRIKNLKISEKFTNFRFLFYYSIINYFIYVIYWISLLLIILFLPILMFSESAASNIIISVFYAEEIFTDIMLVFLLIGAGITAYSAVKKRSLKFSAYALAFLLLILFKIRILIFYADNILN